MKSNIHNDDAGGEFDPNGSDFAHKAFYSFTLHETDISLVSGTLSEISSTLPHLVRTCGAGFLIRR